jgi:ethanolamine ammonia-lyase small subunit
LPTDPRDMSLLPRGDSSIQESDLPELIQKIRARTPARLLMGRAGTSYRTATQLDLRKAHAAARDAVRDELDLQRDFGREFLADWNLFEVCTSAASKDEYLLRPDLGRHFDQPARKEILQECPRGCDLQIAIGDGLSVTAVRAQVPQLLPALIQDAKTRGWSVGRPFIIRHCRVGILNQIGELLTPRVVVLLIGERPGLATAESLSAYMAYRPTKAHSDADRNLISNIHSRGLRREEAVEQILNLAAQIMAAETSGYTLRQ